ncbi:MAG: hypothetical protein LDL23_06980 [Flavobacterium sp.]|uniref:hypothetical protein n=1 Tax=Flavobacterium sp. TaxID=239 RepID=UPI0025BE75B1|nr:hypothetical protein [Flavobacterium sp.]MCA1966379.1 hypothetical protein [Flavobacterium sp.]
MIAINCALKSNNYSNDLVGVCMNKYSGIATALRNYNNGVKVENTNDLMYKYFDITNEELFYIRNENVSPEVSYDWMSGMIKQLKKFKKEKDFEEILAEYPRIAKTFDIDFDKIDGKNISSDVIEKCVDNLQEYNLNK